MVERRPRSARCARPTGDGAAATCPSPARSAWPARTACRAPTVTGDDALVTAVSRTLWPATWGYWLTQFVGLGAAGLDRDDCDWAREHAARFVRPGGPLPTLRVGRQPYGLLPDDVADPVPGRRPRDPARRDRRRPDRDGVATGARPGRTGRARRPGRRPRRRAAARRPVRRRVAAPRPRPDVRRQRPRLPLARRARSRRGARSRPHPAAHGRRLGLSATIAGALLVYEPTAWPVDLPLVGDDHATVLATCSPPTSTPSPPRPTSGRRRCWRRWSVRAGCASTPSPPRR